MSKTALIEAIEKFVGYRPSSPSIALLKDGETVAFVPRHHIEGRDAEDVAALVVQALESHCGAPRP